MNKHVIFFFAIGAAIGATVTYFYTVSKEREKNERDIAELKAYYNNEFKEKLAQKHEKMAKNDENSPKIELQNSNDNSENQYEKVIESVKEEKIEVVADHTSPVLKVDPPKENRVIISGDEFLEDDEYDKETLYYFEEDEVFSDPEYVVVPDGINLVGKENLDHVGMFEDNVLYVRNELFGKDYEVIFHDQAYSDVSGIDYEGD